MLDREFSQCPIGASGRLAYTSCSLTDYLPFASGQALETGRDQIHVQGGIAHLTEAALCLWNQGDQFVYLENNRLLASVEYHARYNLGFDDLPPVFETFLFDVTFFESSVQLLCKRSDCLLPT